MKRPSLWYDAPESKAGLLESYADLGVFGELLNFIEHHPEADTEEILVRWSDEAKYAELLQRAQKAVEISPEEMSLEFNDGLERLYRNLLNYRRKRTLAELKENPDDTEFRKFMRSRGAGSDPK